MFTYNILVIAVLSTKSVLTRQTTNDAQPNKSLTAHTFQGMTLSIKFGFRHEVMLTSHLIALSLRVRRA